MKRIETMKCRCPIMFWIGWVAIAVWMVLPTISNAFKSPLLSREDLVSCGLFLLILGMFLMFRSLDWREVEYFFFVKHPGRLRKIGFDYVFMFAVFCSIPFMSIELFLKALVMLSLGIYLYDMLKLIGFHWPIKRALNEDDFVF